MINRNLNHTGRFTFDAEKGKWSFHDGQFPLIESMDMTIELDDMNISCFTNIVNFDEHENEEDVHGKYREIVIDSRPLVGVECKTTFKLYTEGCYFTMQANFNNVSGRIVKIGKCSFLDKTGNSPINLRERSSETLVLCETAWVLNNCVKKIDSESRLHFSKTIGLLYNPHAKLALGIGFLTFDRINTEIIYEYSSDGTIMAQLFCYFDGYELAPGNEISSETAYVELSDNPYVMLENWAFRVNKHYHPVFAAKPSIGWLGGWTWRDGFTQESYEQIVLDNVKAIQKRLAGFEVKNIWVSIGNLKEMLPGKWMEENKETFPHGWEWLIKKLDTAHQKLGFWIAPFWIPDSLSGLFHEHKDNLLKKDGNYVWYDSKWRYGLSGELPPEERTGFFSLDGSHPRTLDFLRDVFEYYNKLGIRYYMIDFLFAGSGSTPGHFLYDEYYDRTQVKGPEVYRKALKAIREAAGDDAYLLSSTGTTFQNIGCVDAVRVASDYGEGRPLIKGMNEYPATYTINAWNLIRSVASTMAATYFTDRKLYFNDAWNVLTIDKPVPLDEARVNVSMFALSSGPVMLGDDIATISEERLALIKKCLPQYYKMAKPADLFTSVYPDWPKVFNLKVDKIWDEWNVIGLLNTEATTKTFELGVRELELEKGVRYTVFDFWNEMYVGEISDTLTTEVAPYSIKVLRLAKARNHPWLISTDMHLTQGGVEVEQLEWNAEQQYLAGVSVRPKGEKGNLYLRLPKGWKPIDYKGLHTAKVPFDKSVIALKRIDFHEEWVKWRVDFEMEADTELATSQGTGEEREILN